METMSDGDGYNFCGNGWEWLDFPLPCRSLAATDVATTTSATQKNHIGHKE